MQVNKRTQTQTIKNKTQTRKVLALTLTLLSISGLSSCGKKNKTTIDNNSLTTTTTITQTETATAIPTHNKPLELVELTGEIDMGNHRFNETTVTTSTETSTENSEIETETQETQEETETIEETTINVRIENISDDRANSGMSGSTDVVTELDSGAREAINKFINAINSNDLNSLKQVCATNSVGKHSKELKDLFRNDFEEEYMNFMDIGYINYTLNSIGDTKVVTDLYSVKIKKNLLFNEVLGRYLDNNTTNFMSVVKDIGEYSTNTIGVDIFTNDISDSLAENNSLLKINNIYNVGLSLSITSDNIKITDGVEKYNLVTEVTVYEVDGQGWKVYAHNLAEETLRAISDEMHGQGF